jgi:hypothetical protein
MMVIQSVFCIAISVFLVIRFSHKESQI